MGLRLGDTAPDFTADSTEGTIHFHEWIGDQWAILFSQPVATPVNGKKGEDCILVPNLSDTDAKEEFPGGWKTLEPCLRLVPEPKD